MLRAKKGFRNLLFIDLIVIAVYAGLGILFIYKGSNFMDIGNYDLVLAIYLFLLLIWNIGRYLGYRNQFRAYNKGFFGLVKSIWKIVFWPFQSRWCITLSVAVMFIALYGAVSFFSWLLLAALFIHLLLIYLFLKNGAKSPNFKLLILRVFLIDKTSSFTFNGLVNFWKHFGTYFTVADPSFYKVNWKKKFNYYFPIYVLIIFLIFTQLTDNADPNSLGGLFGGFVVLLIICAIIFIILSVRSMKRKFISNEDLLKRRIKKQERWPKGFDNTFKEFPVMCYDNTWKAAVNELVKTSNVILMDLRGFSEINKGCEYEIDFLFDHVPAEKVVFLSYKDAVPLVKKTINERWKMLLETSPNLHAKSPETLLYITTKQNNKDIQGVIDVLLATAVKAETL